MNNKVFRITALLIVLFFWTSCQLAIEDSNNYKVEEFYVKFLNSLRKGKVEILSFSLDSLMDNSNQVPVNIAQLIQIDYSIQNGLQVDSIAMRKSDSWVDSIIEIKFLNLELKYIESLEKIDSMYSKQSKSNPLRQELALLKIEIIKKINPNEVKHLNLIDSLLANNRMGTYNYLFGILEKAKILTSKGDYISSKAECIYGLGLFSKFPNISRVIKADFLFQSGLIELNQLDFEKGEYYFKKADSLYQSFGNNIQIAKSAINLAISNLYINENEIAQKQIEKALEIEIIDPYWKSYIIQNAAVINSYIGNKFKAEKLFNYGLSTIEKLTVCQHRYKSILILLAEHHLRFGNFTDGYNSISKAISDNCLPEEQLGVDIEYQMQRVLGQFYLAKCSTHNLLECSKYLKLFEKLDSLSADFVKEDEYHYSDYLYLSARDKIKVLSKIKSDSSRNYNLNEAFNTLKRTKYRSIKEQQYLNKFGNKLARKLAIEKKQEELIFQIEKLPERSKSASPLINKLHDITQEKDKIIIPEIKNKKEANAEFIDINKLQKWLRENNSQAVEYLEDNGGYWCFYISPDTAYYELVNPKIKSIDVEKIANKLRTNESNKDSLVALYNDLKTLNSILIKPYVDSTIKNLIIIPDLDLAKIPFEALRTNKSFLLDQYDVSYSYGIDELTNYQSNIDHIETTSFMSHSDNVTFNSLDKKEYPEIIGSYKEITACANLIDCNSKLYSGMSCTKSNLQKSLQSGITHLAVHAFSNAEDKMDNYIIVRNQDSIEVIYGYQFGQFKIDSKHMILSACQSGEGKYLAGEGIHSISRYLIQQGVPSTIKSLWLLDDQASLSINSAYYNYLKMGWPTTKALNQSKREYITKTNSHPYYWASLVLEGNPVQSFEFCPNQ